MFRRVPVGEVNRTCGLPNGTLIRHPTNNVGPALGEPPPPKYFLFNPLKMAYDEGPRRVRPCKKRLAPTIFDGFNIKGVEFKNRILRSEFRGVPPCRGGRATPGLSRGRPPRPAANCLTATAPVSIVPTSSGSTSADGRRAGLTVLLFEFFPEAATPRGLRKSGAKHLAR